MSIDVNIIPATGPFLFNGAVPGMDQVQYDCTLVLRNLTDKAEEAQVGFPIASQFLRGSEQEPEKGSPRDWVLNYGFIASDEATANNLEFVRRQPGKDAGEFGAVFLWKMNFAPKERLTLRVSYQIPMSMGLVSTQRDGQASKSPQTAGALAQELMVLAQMEMIG